MRYTTITAVVFFWLGLTSSLLLAQQTIEVGEMRAESMACRVEISQAEDGSAVGFLVVLMNLSPTATYRLRGWGHTLSVEATWSGRMVGRNDRWEEVVNWGGSTARVHSPRIFVEFIPGQSFRYFVPFAALLEKALPAESITECFLTVAPDFEVDAVQKGVSENWSMKEIAFLGPEQKKHLSIKGLILNQKTLDAASVRSKWTMPVSK